MTSQEKIDKAKKLIEKKNYKQCVQFTKNLVATGMGTFGQKFLIELVTILEETDVEVDKS